MHMNKILTVTVGLATASLIAACSVSTDLDATLEREVENTVSLKEQAKVPSQPITNDVIRVKDDIWLGDTSEIEYEGEPVPSYLETDDGITLISNRPITLFEIGDMINKITSLSVMTKLWRKLPNNKPTAMPRVWTLSVLNGPTVLKCLFPTKVL